MVSEIEKLKHDHPFLQKFRLREVKINRFVVIYKHTQ
jgi:hypothetical protein